MFSGIAVGPKITVAGGGRPHAVARRIRSGSFALATRAAVSGSGGNDASRKAVAESGGPATTVKAEARPSKSPENPADFIELFWAR
jgi:hypothetical protein